MAAMAALIALVTPAIDDSILLAVTAGTAKAIRPARLLQSGLALLLSPVELHELWEGKPSLELDAIAGHWLSGICVLL
jgi:hypothetical protein